MTGSVVAWDEAAAHYREVLRLRPHDVDACLALGQVYKEQGRLQEAVASFRQAASIRQHHERRQVIREPTEAVTQPRTHAREARKDEPGVHLRDGRHMVRAKI